MTNTIILITVAITNWIAIPGNTKQQDGTNYVWAVPVVYHQTYIEEVSLCTNRTLYRVTAGKTNGTPQWRTGYLPPPPLPIMPR